MTQYPPAIHTLIGEVTEARPDATIEPTGEPDGFGRTRSVHFDPDTAGWLEPILDVLEDERVADYASNKKGLIVTVVPDVRADQATPFEIADVDEVLNGED